MLLIAEDCRDGPGVGSVHPRVNRDSVLLRFCWNENVVLCAVDLPAQNLDYSEIADAAGAVGAWADKVDDLLKAEFGGQLMDEEGDSGQTVDQEGLIAWISEQTEILATVVAPVLELEFEYLVGVGIVEDPGYEFRYYSPERLAGKSKVVDTESLAQDAERMLGILTETAEAVYEAETRFLKMRGIIN
ncbi:MAG: YbjN domain-containing protein [Actinomycetota bacterium]|nr:YbjN domain-containing protein [Actinomycetota bacterium]